MVCLFPETMANMVMNDDSAISVLLEVLWVKARLFVQRVYIDGESLENEEWRWKTSSKETLTQGVCSSSIPRA